MRTICRNIFGTFCFTLVVLLAAAGTARAEDNTNIVINGVIVDNGGANFILGNTGTNNTLTINSGGALTNVANSRIGFNVGANKNIATITGAGSLWQNSGDFYVGDSGFGNALTISSGAAVLNAYSYIGAYGDNNTTTVNGGFWTNTANLHVGYSGSGNALTVAGGGSVVNADGYIGYNGGASNNSVTVTGSNSIWTNRINLLVGYSGSGNSLVISNSGSVFNANGYVGFNASASNNTVTVTGTGSVWNNTGSVIVGLGGANNRLTIRAGGTVNAANLTVNNGTLHLDPLANINISGNYTQTLAGTLELAIGGASAGQFGQLTVTGVASLTGTVRFVQFNGYAPSVGHTQQIVRATGGVTGQFGTVDNQVTTLWRAQVFNDGAQNVDVTWIPLTVAPLATSPNQQALARNIDGAVNDPRLAGLVNYLFNLPTNQVAAALDQIAPGGLCSMLNVGFAGMDARSFGFQGRVNELRGGSHGFSANRLSLYDTSGPGKSVQTVAYGNGPVIEPSNNILSSGADNPWGVYLEGNGEFTDVRGDANASGYHLTSGGLTIGIDRRIAEELVVGLTLGYANIDGSLANAGHMGVDNARASLYAVWFNKQGFHLEGSLGGGYNSYDTRRIVFGQAATGTTSGTEFNTLLGGGYDWQKGVWSFGPQLSLQYKRMDIDGFDESGSLAPMHLDSQSQESIQTRLGGRVGCRKEFGRVIVAPELSVAWQHEYENKGASLNSRFVNGAGNTFTTTGPTIGSDSVVIGVGVWVQWTQTVGTYLNYSTELGRDGYDSQNITAGVAVRF